MGTIRGIDAVVQLWTNQWC